MTGPGVGLRSTFFGNIFTVTRKKPLSSFHSTARARSTLHWH
jgi:hypothetical protein